MKTVHGYEVRDLANAVIVSNEEAKRIRKKDLALDKKARDRGFPTDYVNPASYTEEEKKLMGESPYCCLDFEKATREGTDNEGWGPLLYASPFSVRCSAKPRVIGAMLAPISFCPWCGTKL